MSPDEIRETLERHLGSERYTDFLRTFVRVARRKARLTYWQEDALSDAGIHLDFAQCLAVFTLCHVHRLPLSEQAVPLRKDVSDIMYSKEFERATARSFPYAQRFVIFNESLDSAADSIEVDHCKECVRQLEAYLAAETANRNNDLILTVEDVFEIPERGTVVTGLLDAAWSTAKVGDQIDLRAPDGRSIRTTIRALEMFRKSESKRSAGILLGKDIAPDQVVLRSQIRRVAAPSR